MYNNTLSDYDKQYVKDQMWLERNKNNIDAATKLVFDALMEYVSPSKAELDRARKLMDKERALRRQYPTGAIFTR